MPSYRRARVLAAALLGALLAVSLPVSSAHAADRTVAGGRLDWGIKSSFQSYVTGPVAHGSWSLIGGAATVGGSQFRFHSARGSYDAETGAFSAAFSGGVRFVGHRQADGTNQLDLTISRPTIRISGGRGTLYADMASKSKATGRMSSASQVPMASLSLGGVDMRGGGTVVALRGVPVTLTSQGATAFAGYYTAGTPLDALSLSVDVAAPAAQGGAASPSASASAKAKPTASASASASAKTAGAVTTAAVDWGVRRTFREYVTGDIAKGRWELADGAQDGGALFRFGAGKGSYDRQKGTLDVAFSGSARFLGMEQDGRYGLDLTLGRIRVAVAGGKGTLYSGHTPLVTFDAPVAALKPKGGLIALTEVETTLTAEGAKTFNGLYTAGTAMDPLTLSVALDASAALPALPDLGSGAELTPSAEPSATASAEPTASPAPQQAAATGSFSGFPVLPVSIGAAVLAAAAAGAVVLRNRRRSSADSASDAGPQHTP
ncbi:HtaA domain-containing protein [Peterkaempfera bronchialis]|uniref:HtaA domain-containing protein n=1 Tax=Peterkaempfera bronchialis TaxID=2126346 RepID=UPI003C30A122